MKTLSIFETMWKPSLRFIGQTWHHKNYFVNDYMLKLRKAIDAKSQQGFTLTQSKKQMTGFAIPTNHLKEAAILYTLEQVTSDINLYITDSKICYGL